jgi:deoxyribonuclease V
VGRLGSHGFLLSPLIEHPWDLDAAEAEELQIQLARKVKADDRLPSTIRSIAGVDAAYLYDGSGAVAAVVILEAGTGEVLDKATAACESPALYTPGLLSFREIPVIASALQKLTVIPDLIVCDGHGIAHPRRFGLACHLGVLYDVPAIGCAKTRLIGEFAEPGSRKGDSTYLMDNGEAIGVVLRTRQGVKPVFVSPGHRISLRTSSEVILQLCSRFRIPEPIRLADQISNRLKKQAQGTDVLPLDLR